MSRFSCQGCKAYKGCEGPLRAHVELENVYKSWDLLIIGEAPYAVEEKEGSLLSTENRITSVLTSTLEGITDSFIYTNCRCCYGKKPPVPTEIKACKKNWKKLIARYRPSVVVALGQKAAVAVLGRNVKMKEDVGHTSTLNVLGHESIFIINYSPGQLLSDADQVGKNGESVENIWVETWDKISSFLEDGLPELPEVEILMNPKDIKHYLKTIGTNYTGKFAYDYETWGDVDALRPELNNEFKILCVGVTTEQNTVAFPLEHPKTPANASLMNWWLDFISRCRGTGVAQNSKYEHKCNLIKFGSTFPLECTMLQMNLIDENRPANLNAVIDYCNLIHPGLMDWTFYKSSMLGIQKDPVEAKLSKLLQYCGLDSKAAYMANLVLDEKLNQQDLERAAELSYKYAKLLARVEINGIAVNGKLVKGVTKETVEKRDELEKVFRGKKTVLRTEKWAAENIKSWKKGSKFNVSSPVQVKHFCIDELKLPVLPNREGSYALGKKVLEKFEDRFPILKSLTELRGVKSLLTGLLVKWPEYTGPDNCVHTQYTQDVTATGRLSSKKPNVQNITKGSPVRKLFVSRYKRGGLMSGDYSQIEGKILAALSGDKNMIRAFKEKLDLHLFVASEIYSMDYDEIKIAYTEGDEDAVLKRHHGKQMNLGMGFGITKYGLSAYTGLSIDEAQNLIDLYDVKFPGIKDFRNKLHRQAITKGYVCDLFGRRRHLPGARSNVKWVQDRALRQAGNAPIQSTDNQFTLIAACILQQLLFERNIRAVIINLVHDSILLDYDLEWEKQAKEAMLEPMLIHNKMDYWKDLGVEITVDISTGKNLYEVKG
tara:strand:- start:630 stop:3110 length:2481 start_codon:yes stop_codon:yes gene_type:complete